MQPGADHTSLGAYRYGYTAFAYGFLSRTAGLGGRAFAAWVARSFVGFYLRSQPGVVATVARNIALLDGAPPDSGKAHSALRNYAATLADYFWLSRRSVSQGIALARFESGIESIRAALAEGRGAILATGHYGFFEFGGLVLGHMGFPVSIITHPEPSATLHEWRADYRKRWGAETITLGEDAFSSLRAVEAIESGRFTAVLVDRPTGGPVVSVELPGGKVPFSSSPALLSWITGCHVLPVAVRRLPDGAYAIAAGEGICADRSLPRCEAIADCTRRIARDLTSRFLKDPLQWYHFVPLESLS